VSGHSKWSQIKRKKELLDSKRGKVFSRLAKEIAVAARMGGGANMDGNARLRTVVDKAKAANMPADNIKRAIQKGSGEIPGALYEEIMYEGYGPGGCAVMIEAFTDNRNRTVGEIRFILSKKGGNLGETGSVGWMFSKKGYLLVDKKGVDEDTLLQTVLDAGADDLKNDPADDYYEVFTPPEGFGGVVEAIRKVGMKLLTAEITMIPKTYVDVDEKTVGVLLRLIDDLEENDDVQNVYVNFAATDAMLSSVSD
jgi:YebC/PmpR family DNA-binding regulatory protein